MSSYKRQRTADLLLSFLAQELRRLTDPRLELVTLTGADVSPDLRNAWIYWSEMTLPRTGEGPSFPDETRVRTVEEALKGATQVLKRRIGAELGLRYVPSLVFRYDHSFENASRIEELVKQTSRESKESPTE
jgi:ribosome-binding factor A